MKVLLVFPPHLALPALTAYLRTNGVEVIQRDLNAEVFDRSLYACRTAAREALPTMLG